MGKRSDFERRPNDAYPTPRAAVPFLIPFLSGVSTYAEPCAGDGQLIGHLAEFGLTCGFRNDIEGGLDALEIWSFGEVDAIITNPPWTRKLLHPMIEHFQQYCPTWLLFDSDWAFTKQAARYLQTCSHIVSVGRLKWIPDSPYSGKDNCAWFCFDAKHIGGPRFYGFNEEARDLTGAYA